MRPLTRFRPPAYTGAPMAAHEQQDDRWSGMGTGWAITSTMIGGILGLGLFGSLLDRLFGIEHVFLPIGFILGGAAGVYIIWLRYGRGEGDET
jgi:F0F1-type ATP synthase assembly protein I